MVVQLIYKDGTEEIVDRCFMVESRARRGAHGWRTRFVSQRHAGAPLHWFRPRDVEHVNYDRPDLMPADEPPRKAI